MKIPNVAGRDNNCIEPSRDLGFSSSGIPQFQTDPAEFIHLHAGHIPQRDDVVRPRGLIIVAKALVVEGIIEALNQFQTDNAIIGWAVLGDGFAADIGGEGIEGINAGWVENFVYAVGREASAG